MYKPSFLITESKVTFTKIKETCKQCKTVEEVLEALGIEEGVLDEATLEYVKNEVSMTGAAAPIATPNAFKDKKMSKKKITRENVSAEDFFLGEATYRDYSNGTARGRIGSSIKEINRRLSEMEKIVGHATRLKTESETSSAKYSTSTRNNIKRIKERMVNVIKGLQELES